MATPYASTYDVIALLGPDGVGKTTLFYELAHAVGDPTCAPRGIQAQGCSATVLDVRTPRRVCQIADFADAATEATLLGASRFAGAVLVVAADDSLVPGHRESLERARHFGIPLLAAALTRCDVVEDEEIIELVEMEIREIATKYGYRGDGLPVVRTHPITGRGAAGEPEPGRRASGVRAVLSILVA